ncbi:MAG: NUDIX hydrolase [archaeon]|nr:NUDIX hydrolase [archaeon]
MEQYNFQYCQKIVVLSSDQTKVLLCKRKGEADYDGIFSFIGGKMETTDENIIEGLQREKNEEVGENFKIKIYPKFSYNLLFRKKAGNSMILPHYLAIHLEGEVILNEEYSEYQWVSIKNLSEFEPKISSILDTVKEVLRLQDLSKEEEYIVI